MDQCLCGSLLPSELCCEQYVSGAKSAPTAEALMRSRYTAFAQRNAQYLFNTFSKDWREGKTVEEMQKGLSDVHWTGLEIIAIFEGRQQHQTGEVEFVAHYTHQGQSYTLHERSLFVREDGEWRYLRAKN